MQPSALEKYMVERVARFVYDFSIHGGAIGDITLDDDIIPDDALVTSGAVCAKAALTSADAATVTLTLMTAADILDTAAIADMEAGENLAVVPVAQTAATWVKTTASKNLTMTIADFALTAGKFEVFLRYFIGM